MMGPVYEVLKSEYQRQQEEGFCVAEVDGMTNFIFTNRFGNPHNPQAVNRAIKRIVDTHNAEEEVEAKKKKREPIMLPRFSCHIFRHTFASRFCENETNVKVIQEVITLIIFTIFTTVLFKGETLHWNHFAAFMCLVLAVYFVFLK